MSCCDLSGLAGCRLSISKIAQVLQDQCAELSRQTEVAWAHFPDASLPAYPGSVVGTLVYNNLTCKPLQGLIISACSINITSYTSGTPMVHNTRINGILSAPGIIFGGGFNYSPPISPLLTFFDATLPTIIIPYTVAAGASLTIEQLIYPLNNLGVINGTAESRLVGFVPGA